MNVDIPRFRPLTLGALAVGMWAAATAGSACVEGDFRGEAVTIEREVGSTASGAGAAIQVIGAGYFHAAEIVKQGGSNDNTNVTLELDGEAVFTNSFATLKDPWRELATRFIVINVRTQGNTSTMTIWYSPELKFRGILALRVGVHEDGVDSLRMRAVMNKPAPHEHLLGQPTALALPAFK